MRVRTPPDAVYNENTADFIFIPLKLLYNILRPGRGNGLPRCFHKAEVGSSNLPLAIGFALEISQYHFGR